MTQHTAVAPTLLKPSDKGSHTAPTFTIPNDAAVAEARAVVERRVEDLALIVEGNESAYTKGRMSAADAAGYVRDCEMLRVAQQAAKELSKTGKKIEISAQTLEFLRCEIPQLDTPAQDGFAPHLPYLGGAFFTFDRPLGTDRNALGADNLTSEPYLISIPITAAVRTGSRQEIALARTAVLDALCQGYKDGEAFSDLLHGLEKLLHADGRPNLSLSGLSPFVIRRSELTDPSALSALKLKISEAFDVSNHRIVGGVEVRIQDDTTGSNRFLNRSIPEELELDRLCSRALIEEIGHTVQGARLPATGLDKIAINESLLSPLTVQFLEQSRSGIAIMRGLVAKKYSGDVVSKELRNQGRLTQLVEIDILAFFVERWRALSLPIADLQPEIEQFHQDLRKPFVDWCRAERILPKKL